MVDIVSSGSMNISTMRPRISIGLLLYSVRSDAECNRFRVNSIIKISVK